MEGNDCYKYSTIAKFVVETNGKPIESVMDVGANIGDTLLLAHSYFPEARLIGYEPVKEYSMQAIQRTQHIPNVCVRNAACGGHHLYRDDFGHEPRQKVADLYVHFAMPESGPGWVGGSIVDVSPGSRTLLDSAWARCYKLRPEAVVVRSLEELLTLESLPGLDILKLDCEGCEYCLLGSSSTDVLRKIRFICGEYHDVQRFYQIMKRRLFETHKVCLVGERLQGSFFAERLNGTNDGILRFSRAGMYSVRPHLGPDPLDWNPFNEFFVADHERGVHGLSS